MRQCFRILAAATIVLAAVAAYHGSFRTPFVFDDVESIADNPTIRQAWPPGPALSPPAGGATVSGRPLLNYSFALNYAISGQAVWSYHVLNLAIHIGAGLLLFGIVRRLLGADPFTALHATALAWAAALLWTLQPLQTEAVTYIVQRAESLAGFFYLLTLYSLVRQAHTAQRASTVGWAALSVAACLLGLATKETVVTAPLAAALLDRIYLGGSWRGTFRRRRLYYIALAGTWLFLGWLLARNGGNRGGTIGFHVAVPWWAYALTQFKALTYYIRAIVWPHPLVFEYGTYWVQSASEMLPYAVVVVATAAATLIALWRHPRAGFLAAWFFIILAPTSSVVPGVSQMIVEHRLYLALAGPLVLLTLALWRMTVWIGGNAVARASLAAPLTIAAAFGVLTEQRNHDYRSALALWRDTVAKRPENPWAHCDLGVALFDAGRIDEAIVHYELSLRLNPSNNQPGNAQTYYNLANAQAATGRRAEAIANYQAALLLEPGHAQARCNLGNTLAADGRIQEGMTQIVAALRLNPESAKAHNDLGYVLARAGRINEAIAEYRTAIRLRPDDATVAYNLGTTLVQAGQLDPAIASFREAVRLRPAYAEAHNNLANALARAGRGREALSEYARALALQPGYIEARYNLALTLDSLGRFVEARRELEIILKFKSDFPAARQLLGTLQNR